MEAYNVHINNIKLLCECYSTLLAKFERNRASTKAKGYKDLDCAFATAIIAEAEEIKIDSSSAKENTPKIVSIQE